MEIFETVKVDKLIHGGQGLGTLADGRKIFVWNALPGEKVKVRITRNKKSYAEGIAEKVIKASAERVEPLEDNFLATSPWQILDFAAENHWKKEITRELFTQAGINLPPFDVRSGKAAPVRVSESEFSSEGAMENPPGVFHYRNKMEYSFWGDDDGIHLALHDRGTHQKRIVGGSALALPAIDKGAKSLLNVFPKNTRAGDLKTIIVRTSQSGDVVAALFVKREDFHALPLPPDLKGLRVYYSDPKSPASIPTKLLQELGDSTLSDELMGKRFAYDVDSFFQVNVPVFELALEVMAKFAADNMTDMYAGVGSIGLSLAKKTVNLVEIDPATAEMARRNVKSSPLKAKVIETSSEKALEYITTDRAVIFDPPRAGLHGKIIDRLLEAMPPRIIYLSCNPATQARDLALLRSAYEIGHFEIFNFFPRTPHIETLAILEKT